MRHLSHFLSLIALLTLASCRTASKQEPELKPGESPPLWGWNEEAAAEADGTPQVKIVLKEQKAYIKKGETDIGWSFVATGISKYPTPTGTYSIMERTSDKHSNLYGRIYDAEGKCINTDAKMGRDPIPEGGKFEGAQMAYWMRLTHDGLGMHVGPIPRPGSRASHGCIRLPKDAAQKIFHTVRAGTQVTVVQEADDPQPPKRTISPPLPGAPKPKAVEPTTAPGTGLPPLDDKPPSLSVPLPPPPPKPPGT